MRTSFEKLAMQLRDTYDYYETVATGFLVEAIQNAIDDGFKFKTLDELHRIIIENYI